MRKSILILLLILAFVPLLSFAQTPTPAPNCTANYNSPRLCNALPFFGGQAVTDIPTFIAALFTWLAGLIGTLALVMIIYGGAQMIFAQGDSAVVAKGKGTITNAVYGIIIIMFAYVIVSAVQYFVGVRDNVGDPGAINRNFFFNPLREEYLFNTSFPAFVDSVIRDFLGILGVIAVLYIIIAGFRYVSAQGNEDQVKKAKDSIKWAVIGLICIILSYVIISVVINTIGSAGQA